MVIEVNEVVEMFSVYLEQFAHCETLQHRLLTVLKALPEPVVRDFVDDPRFRVSMDQVVPGKGRTVQLASPGPVGESSRCVVLKQRLDGRSEAFACYVIAHEFAHAYLRNGGWGNITDVEEAADALAASWGFRRPAEDRTVGISRKPTY